MKPRDYLMDILEWLFKKRPRERHLSQIDKINATMQYDVDTIHNQWSKLSSADARKKTILEAINIKGASISYLKPIPQLNSRMVDALENLTQIINNESLLVKKIMVQSVERLHEAESWIWRHGRTTAPHWDPEAQQVSGPKGRRTPYVIEAKKRAVWMLVQDEKRFQPFVKKVASQIEPEIREIQKTVKAYKTTLHEQTIASKAKNWRKIIEEEQKQIDPLRKIKLTLSDITNKIILFAQETTEMLIEERKIRETADPDPGRQKIGLLLVHGIASEPIDLEIPPEFERKGYIIYNVRLPGHAKTPEEFFNTSLPEMINFLISAFKYFYEYMGSINKRWKPGRRTKDGTWIAESIRKDGRFYVMGLSLGAMMMLHILGMQHRGGKGMFAKKLFPYQAMVKGCVSLGATLYPVLFSWLWKAQGPIVGFVGPRLARRDSFKGEPVTVAISDIDEKIQEVLKYQTLQHPKFEQIMKEAVWPLLKQRIDQKNQILQNEGATLPTAEEEEESLNRIFDKMIQNLKAGKRAFGTGGILNAEEQTHRAYHQAASNKGLAEMIELLAELRKDVKKIKIPIVVMQGLHDEMAHTKSAQYIYDNVRTEKENKKMIILRKSRHVITLDYEKDKVWRESFDFIERTEKKYQQGEEILGKGIQLQKNPSLI